MPRHRPRPQRRSRTRARCSSRRCRRGSGTGGVAPLDRLPNATRRVPTPALASTRSPIAELGRRCAERSAHPLADSASTPRSHLGRSRQTSRFILSLDTLGSCFLGPTYGKTAFFAKFGPNFAEKFRKITELA